VTEGSWGVSPLLAACAAAGLAAGVGLEMSADQVTASTARLVAAQRIRADAIDTLRPAALSHDGQLIAFVSRPPASSQRYCCQHVYVFDRATGLITQESIDPRGTPAHGDSDAPSLSADGRIIAFETVAPNLFPGDLPVARRHVVVRNRQNGVLRTPQDSRGQRPDGESGQPILSGNGRTLVFTSDAVNLVPGPDANGPQTDIYLWRLEDSTITRISVDSHGVQPPIGASHSPSVGRDGDLVAFVSTARLAPGDTDDIADVYLRDVRRSLTLLVSRSVSRRRSDDGGHSPALSADGRYVAFVSKAGSLAPRDRNDESDVYLYDVASGSIALVSATASGAAANAASRRPALSADGRYIAYQSVASNLGSGPGCPPTVRDTNLLADVYLFDRVTGCVTRVSSSPAREWWTPSVVPAIDGACTLVAFSSTQPVGENDVSTDFDLFLFLRPSRERLGEHHDPTNIALVRPP